MKRKPELTPFQVAVAAFRDQVRQQLGNSDQILSFIDSDEFVEIVREQLRLALSFQGIMRQLEGTGDETTWGL